MNRNAFEKYLNKQVVVGVDNFNPNKKYFWHHGELVEVADDFIVLIDNNNKEIVINSKEVLQLYTSGQRL